MKNEVYEIMLFNLKTYFELHKNDNEYYQIGDLVSVMEILTNISSEQIFKDIFKK